MFDIKNVVIRKYTFPLLATICAVWNVSLSFQLDDGTDGHSVTFSSLQLLQSLQSQSSVVSTEEIPLRWRHKGLFEVNTDATGRKERFPSVEDRVLFYMSSWYSHESCGVGEKHATSKKLNSSFYRVDWLGSSDGFSDDTTSNMTVSIEPAADTLFIAHNKSLLDCADSHQKNSLRVAYCPELMLEVLPLYEATRERQNAEIPLLVQVGDAFRTKQLYDERPRWMHPAVPHLKKFRNVWKEGYWDRFSQRANACHLPATQDGKSLPIIWKLEAKRHYVGLDEIPLLDTAWDEKRNQSVFRGAISGKFNMSIEDEYERCMDLPRCRLVLTHADSKLVDANMTNFKQAQVSATIRGIRIQGKKASKRELLSYKALVILEGNDVSTGLKWALLSNSVVLMPTPSVTSWMMEEWLQPYVHYIPLKEDLSDVEEQTTWVLQHDRKARQISLRATLWMKDLLFHEDAAADNEMINREILSRYRSLFKVT